MSFFDLFSKKKCCNTQTHETSKVTSATEKECDTVKNETADPATEEKKTTGEEICRVFNLILLDESGSMSVIYHPALTGVNETLHTIREAQKKHASQRHFVTLMAFDDSHCNRIYSMTPANEAVNITTKQYRPGGRTPLYDAMGYATTELRKKVTDDDVVLVTIITDGYENASREYTEKAIKALVEEMKSKGWVFTYIGANQDVEAVGASMAIDNRLAFEADDESTGAMFDRESCCRDRFFKRLAQKKSKKDLQTGYFDEDEDDYRD